MNKLSQGSRRAVLSLLLEGQTIRQAAKGAGVTKGTVLRLVSELGGACRAFHSCLDLPKDCPRKVLQVENTQVTMLPEANFIASWKIGICPTCGHDTFVLQGEPLERAFALHAMYHNFCKEAQGRTPAVAARLAKRIWTVDDILLLPELGWAIEGKPGRY